MKRCCLALALGVVATAAGAATTPIYRCGQTYSQTPCAGGHIIESSDPRSAAQRTEARRLAEREKALAEKMERERRAAEKAAAKATAVEARTPVQAVAASGVGKESKTAKAAAAPGSGVLFITPRPPTK